MRYSWPQDAVPSEEALHQRLSLLDPAYPNPRLLTSLLFDEAQDSYEDEFLWGYFLKGVQDGLFNEYRVILFCSYGSPSSRPVYHRRGGTPLVLADEARVSLRPTERSLGLLLSRVEFDEVVARREPKLNLHPDLLDRILNWTTGHVGAIVQLLDIISSQVSH